MRFLFLGFLFEKTLGEFVIGSNVCSPEVVTAAATAGFLRYAFECIREDVLGPELCLVRFMAEREVSIPLGACRTAYQTLLDEFALSNVHSCYEIAEGEEFPDWSCFADIIGSAVQNFYMTVGQMPATLCSAAQVRARAGEDTFSQIVAEFYYDPLTANTATVPSETTCDWCYGIQMFEFAIYQFQSVYLYNPGTLELCAENPLSEICLGSGTIVKARRVFEDCAGIDIFFNGPVCTPEQVAAVEDLVPKPYYLFAHCAYHPSTLFCKYIEPYVAQIESSTSVNCVACYTEFQTNMADYAYYDVEEFCLNDVFANTCIGYLADALDAFEKCSGSTLNVNPPIRP